MSFELYYPGMSWEGILIGGPRDKEIWEGRLTPKVEFMTKEGERIVYAFMKAFVDWKGNKITALYGVTSQ